MSALLALLSYCDNVRGHITNLPPFGICYGDIWVHGPWWKSLWHFPSGWGGAVYSG